MNYLENCDSEPTIGWEYDPAVGWFLSKAIKSATHLVKSAVHTAGSALSAAGKGLKKATPFLQVAAGVTAFVCPAVGVPALAAITAAKKVMDATQSANATVAKAAVKAIAATVTRAKHDPAAARGLRLLQTVKGMQRARAAKRTIVQATGRKLPALANVTPKHLAPAKLSHPPVQGALVLKSGRIVRGSWRLA
jgi:hypothetical protein